MLSKILKDNIGIEKEALTWKESIRTASVPLIKNGKIEEKYVEAMINDIERMGFYVVITDKVAMPHSRPENGVNETSLSLLKLDKIVKYGNLIFILAAENKDKHIEILKELSEFLDEDDEIEKIINAKTIEEIEKIFKERETELC